MESNLYRKGFMGIIDKAKELLGFSDPTITVNMEGAKKPDPLDDEEDTFDVEEKIFGGVEGGAGIPPTLNLAKQLNSDEQENQTDQTNVVENEQKTES